MGDGRGRRNARPLRWAAGAALLAAGAVALFANGRRPQRLAPAPVPDATVSGRGTPAGQPSAEARAHGYETVDTNVRSLVIIMVVSIVIMVVGTSAVFYVYDGFSRADQSVGRTLTPEQARVIPPPEPRLQAEPFKELDAILAAQRERLSTYGWSGSPHKSPHIPIARAMDLVAGKPLDPAPKPEAASSPDTAATPSGAPAPAPNPAAAPKSPGETP